MKRKTFILTSLITIAAAIYVSPLYAQDSTSIGVKIPFAFQANGKTLPAGEYRIGSASDSRTLWRIGAARGQSARFLLAVTREGNLGEDPIVTFRRYGDRYFLAGFRTLDYSISLPLSTVEKKTRLSDGPMADMELIELKTAASPATAADGSHEE